MEASRQLVPPSSPTPARISRLSRAALEFCGGLALRLALLLAMGALAPLPQDVAAPLIPALWGLGLLLLVRDWRPLDLPWLLLPLAAAALPAPLRGFGLAAAACAPTLARQASGSRLARLALVAAPLSLLIHVPGFQFVFEGAATAANSILGLLSGHALQWGPGPLGLGLLAFFLVDAWLAAPPRSRFFERVAFLRLLLPLAAWLLHQAVWLGLQPPTPAGPQLAPLASLALLLAIASRDWAQTRSRGKRFRPTGRQAMLAAGLSGLALLGLVAAATAPGGGRVDGLRIAFREAGDWSWEVGRHGERPGPRLGGLLEVLRAWGAEVSILSDSTLLESLDDIDIVFAVHPKGPADPRLRVRLFDYMRGGGSLLVVGEHTDVGGILEGVNTLIEPSGIRLRNDSAIPALRGWNWAWCQRALLAPTTRGLENSDDLGISIGGSLDVSWPAMPLIVGTQAFSDIGNPDNPRGKLGDNRWNWGERFGDLPLVAGERVGRGRLMVVGDTSGLMSLSSFRVWPFYLQLVAGLGAPSPWESRVPLAALAALLALAAWMASCGGAYARQVLGLAWLGAALLVAGRLDPRLPAPVQPERIGWVDAAHLPNWMYDSNLDWSVMSVAESIFNADLLPLFHFPGQGAPPATSPFLLLSGPAREIEPAEVDALAAWVESGGHLVLAVDARRGRPAAGLLARFGLRLLDTPLGTAPEAVDAEGAPLGFEFYEAWPFACEAGVDTLASCWGYPIVVERRLGSGRLSVVGDERFFSRRFIEGPNARGGKPLNTARRFLADLGGTPAREPSDPAELAWLREHAADLHRPVVPPPKRPQESFEASRARAWSLLGIQPSHPPGDAPAETVSRIPASGSIEARRMAAQRQLEARRQAARQLAARRAAEGGSPAATSLAPPSPAPGERP